MKKELIKNILSIIVLIIVLFTTYEILKLNILPTKYLIPILVTEIVLYLLGLILYNLKKKALIIIGIIIYIIIIIGNIFGYYYLSKTNKYISKNLEYKTYKVTTKYYVLASKNDNIDNIKNIDKEKKIEYYKYSRSINKALKSLGNYNFEASDTASKSMEYVNNENGYFVIASANYDYLMDSTNLYSRDNYKIIKEFEVSEKIKRNDEIKDTFNIYINGLDFTGIMRDYNLIATVNLKTKKVILTSIPRDYYIDVPAYNMKDTLMCLGSLDSEVSKEALEKLFNTKIDYTINLNTNSLVNIVDTLDGIDFCSDYEFTTTHALVTDTYNDSTGKKLHVTKGCKKYNGTEILTIARERMALPGRDRYRQKNCRQILISIAKKIASTSSLKNYDEILKSFDGLYTTDMNDKVVKNLIKKVLEDPNFEIIEQSVDGTDSIGVGHLGTQEAWIMTPSMDTVNEASNKINKLLKEK